jgi:MFS family permease
MNREFNKSRLFLASCLSLIATSMSFSIRGDIMQPLGQTFGLTNTDLGVIAGPGLWGFAITIVFGGFLVDIFGMKKLMWFAFLGHVGGVLVTIFAQGFNSLYFGTLLIGLANGMVEAVVNPLTASVYSNEKTKYLNILHAWFPGGLMIGGLLAFGLTKTMGLDVAGVSIAAIQFGWQAKMALILVPSFAHGYLLLGQEFPVTERVAGGVSYGEMARECFRPLFLVFLVLMMATASTELGPNQWIPSLLESKVNMHGILVLVYTSAIMFTFRSFFASYFLKVASPLSILTVSSFVAALGLLMISEATTALAVFSAATVFGCGVSFFWPTMLGFVAERFPKGGALALSLMGGAGMLAVGWVGVPQMGRILDHYKVSAISMELQDKVVDYSDSGKAGVNEAKVMSLTEPTEIAEIKQAGNFASSMTFKWIALIPAILTAIFGLVWVLFRSAGGYRSEQLVVMRESARVSSNH